MDIRIGVVQSGRELDVELAEGTDAEKLKKDIASALSEEDGVLWLTDRRGRMVGVPSAKVAFIEITPHEERRVGFGVG